jgi:hypothetical protein
MDSLIQALDPERTGPQPHNILVEPGGNIAFRHTGMISETELVEKVLKVLTPYYLPGK